jgi:hypothetical protein
MRAFTTDASAAVEALVRPGLSAGEISAAMWHAAWTRGYAETSLPIAEYTARYDGFVVFSQPVAAGGGCVILVDCTDALISFHAGGEPPPLAARVRVTPALRDSDVVWSVHVMQRLGLGISVSFANVPRGANPNGWADRLRTTVHEIRAREIQRRSAINAQRRGIAFTDAPASFRDEMAERHRELKDRVEAIHAPTPQDREQFERANERQRKRLIADRSVRRLAAYNAEVAALTAQIPALRADYDRRARENLAARAAIARLEDAASASRSVSERSNAVLSRIDAVERAGIHVLGYDEPASNIDDPALFAEIDRTTELLHDLIPKRAHKLAASL